MTHESRSFQASLMVSYVKGAPTPAFEAEALIAVRHFSICTRQMNEKIFFLLCGSKMVRLVEARCSMGLLECADSQIGCGYYKQKT